jgi:hypothetical protein
LPQFAVHGAHQLLGHVIGHLLGGDADRGRALLQRAEKIGPEAHQAALLLQFQALALQGSGTARAAPEGLVVIAGMGTESNSVAQGTAGGLAFAAAQAGQHEQATGLDSGDAIEAAQLGEAQPVVRRRGRR